MDEWGQYLVDSVEKLQEERSEATGEVRLCLVAAMREAMSERQPVFLDESGEPVDGSIVRVQQHLRHTHNLKIPLHACT